MNKKQYEKRYKRACFIVDVLFITALLLVALLTLLFPDIMLSPLGGINNGDL